MTNEIANRFYELRKAHNLSQEELAERLGVSRQAISKWERAEASPDTDNLIALAKIYGISLDELIYGEKQAGEKQADKTDTDTTKVKIDQTGIFVESDDGDKVKIDLSGIKIDSSSLDRLAFGEKKSDDDPIEKADSNATNVKIGPTAILVESDDGDKVKIDLSGIKIASSASEIFCDDDEDEDDEDEKFETNPNPKAKFWMSFPYPAICAALYLLFGFSNICGGWAYSWIIFITIPLYYSLVDAILKKRFANFAYPVFCAFAYLYIGLYHGNWHPSWLIFLTTPIYYPIAKSIDKAIKSKENIH